MTTFTVELPALTKLRSKHSDQQIIPTRVNVGIISEKFKKKNATPSSLKPLPTIFNKALLNNNFFGEYSLIIQKNKSTYELNRHSKPRLGNAIVANNFLKFANNTRFLSEIKAFEHPNNLTSWGISTSTMPEKIFPTANKNDSQLFKSPEHWESGKFLGAISIDDSPYIDTTTEKQSTNTDSVVVFPRSIDTILSTETNINVSHSQSNEVKMYHGKITYFYASTTYNVQNFQLKGNF